MKRGNHKHIRHKLRQSRAKKQPKCFEKSRVQRAKSNNMQSASQVHRSHNWVSWVRWEQNTGEAPMLLQCSEPTARTLPLKREYSLEKYISLVRKWNQNLTHVLDRPAYCECSPSSLEPPRESEIRQAKVTWIKTHGETDVLLHAMCRMCVCRKWILYVLAVLLVLFLTTVVAVCLSYATTCLTCVCCYCVCMGDLIGFSSED